MSKSPKNRRADASATDSGLDLAQGCHLVMSAAGFDALTASLGDPPERVVALVELFALDRIPAP